MTSSTNGPPCEPPAPAVVAAVARALAEDLLPLGDLTAALIPEGSVGEGRFVSRQAGVVSGRACVVETFRQVDPAVRIQWRRADGSEVGPGDVIALVDGSLASIVTAERTALNFLRHLSGVASLTARFVALVAQASGARTRVLDTRKTTPGLRALEKAAVRAGGGHNHRANLSDGIMLKDNHLVGLSVHDAVARARWQWPGRPVHCECDTLEQLEAIIDSGADRAMLDNMTPAEVAQGVRLVAGRLEVEVTGGISLDRVAEYAAAHPDFISVGALTHSAGVVDIGLDLLA